MHCFLLIPAISRACFESDSIKQIVFLKFSSFFYVKINKKDLKIEVFFNGFSSAVGDRESRTDEDAL